MRTFPRILFLCIFFCCCLSDDNKPGKEKGKSIYETDMSNHPGKIQTTGTSPSVNPMLIEILPYDDLSAERTNYIYRHLKAIFPSVILKEPIPLPQSAYYQPRNRYRADKLIRQLSAQTTSGHVTMALTSKDISTTYGGYEDWGIMGLGYCPGKACIASTFRLSKLNTDEQFFKVAIHEFGHTQGLGHCLVKTCLMRDAKGKNTTDDEKDFCPACKEKLIKAGWPI
jgi:archaemetzincin